MSDFEQQQSYLLSQKLAKKDPRLSFYAMNEDAEKLALLDWFLSVSEKDTLATIIAKYHDAIGTAKAIKKLDTLSKLGLRAGVNVKVEYDTAKTKKK